jgi:Ser/Thr protein kinase RdoA (MazF antagonist)
MTPAQVIEDVLAKFDELADRVMHDTARFVLNYGGTEEDLHRVLDWQRDQLEAERRRIAERVAEEMSEAPPRFGRGTIH